MKRLAALALLTLLFSGCGPEQEPAAAKNNKPDAKTESQGSEVTAKDEKRWTKLSQRKKATHPLAQPARPAPREARPDDWFLDKTAKSGVNFTYRDGSQAGFYEMLEIVGGGVALFDYDADGDIDIFLTGGGDMSGPPIKVSGAAGALYRNDGDWKFTDVTSEAGLSDSSLYTHGCTVGDYNRDGNPDLFIAGFQGVRLFRNEGNGTFADVTEACGIKSNFWNVTAAWADVDNDGWLDLYLVTYADYLPDADRVCLNDLEMIDVCGPTKFGGERDLLWRNRGDGTFEEISEKAGLTERDRGLGIVANDFNEDGWIDFYVANDVNENRLYMGLGDGKFEERGLLAGVAFSATGEREGSMGVDIGDYNGDGQPDLWYTNFTYQDNTLLQKVSEEGFLNVNATAGIAGVSRRWVGFGTGFADFDHDGWEDLFIANGHVRYSPSDAPYFQPAQLMRNENGKTYKEVSSRGGPYFSTPHAGRGAVTGDLDNDGALDLVISHHHEPVVLLRNQLPATSWVSVQLRGTTSNPAAIGGKVTCKFGDQLLVRWVRSGGSYLSSFDPRILFPLADEQPAEVVVRWPEGNQERFTNLQPGRTHVLEEGAGEPSSTE